MQNLEPILIFITVAEMGSFTRAADSLGIQKGRASTAVRKLEEDVGVRLLHRTTRSVQLTEHGRAFHARAQSDLPLAEVDDLHSMFAGDRVGHFSRVFTGRSSDRGGAQQRSVPALAGFHGDLTPSWSWRCRARIGKSIWFKRGFDCVLRLGPIRDETLIARPLGLLRMAWSTLPVPPIWRAMASLDRWKISGVRNTGQFIFRPRSAQNPMDGNIRTETATLRFSYQVRYTSTARRPTKPLPSPALA